MSVQAITCALAVRGVSTTEKLVLLALANYADEHMRCWPSQKRLADDCAMTDRGVRKVLKQLEDRLMLSRENRRRSDGSRQSDVVTLHFFGEVLPSTQAEQRSAPPEPNDRTSGTRVPKQAEPCSGLTTFEPSVEEPSKEPSKRRASAPHAEFESFWSAWPDKRNRGAAEKAFATARRIASLADILAGIPNVTETHAWRDGHRVHASTWLNGKRWLDEPEQFARAPPYSASQVQIAADEWAFREASKQLEANGPARDNQRNQGVVVALSQTRQIAAR